MNSKKNDGFCDEKSNSSRCLNCHIRFSAFCGVLDDKEIFELERLSFTRELRKKQTLFLQGDKAISYFNVRTGSLKIYKSNADGTEQIVGFLFPGDFFGMSHLDEYTYTAEALEPTNVCLFNREDMEKFFLSYPELENKILSIVSQDLTAAQDQIFLLARSSARERVAQFILKLSAQRKKMGWNDSSFQFPMSQIELANYLGIKAETLNRHFKELQKNKIIYLEHHKLSILDHNQLSSFH